MTAISTGTKHKPALDESSFQQLLAAAYVVQAHNDQLRAKAPQVNASQVLSEIARVSALWRDGSLDFTGTVKVVAERLLELARAAGISISLISDGYLDCVAEVGAPAPIPGSSLASHSLVATERLKAGEVFESADAQTDIRLEGALCAQLNVGSLVAAPVCRFGQLAGLIEARWMHAMEFEESDVAACRLFADLVTEILERSSASSEQNRPASASEKPATAASKPTFIQHGSTASEDSPAEAADFKGSADNDGRKVDEAIAQTMQAAPGDSCRVCGRPFGADESFCGHCSMPRTAADSSKGMQSKWASLWHMQEAQRTLEDVDSAGADSVGNGTGAFSRVIAPPASVIAEPEATPAPSARTNHFSYFQPLPAERSNQTTLLSQEDPSLSSRVWRPVRERIRGKDLLMALIAGVLAFGVMSAWPSSTGHPTWLQSAMVRLGLAHTAAPVPVYGSPEIKVWMDAHTALYYCPGSDLYGKTAEGHFGSQSEAQQQHREPAAGLSCQ